MSGQCAGAPSRGCVTYRVWGAAEHNLRPLVRRDLVCRAGGAAAAVLGADCTRLVPLGGRGWPGRRDGRLLLKIDTDTAAQHNTTPHAPKRPLGLSFGIYVRCWSNLTFSACLSKRRASLIMIKLLKLGYEVWN
jgi:hypothetical protein